MTARAALAALCGTFVWAIAVPAQPQQEPPELSALVARTRTSLDAFWHVQVHDFRPPVEVRSYTPEAPSEPCGPIPADNAVYCPQNTGVYYDVPYLDDWRTRIGEHAAITTLAHEDGHRVQHQLGFSESRVGLFTLQKEMMADCLSGAYIRSVNQRTPLSTAARNQITLKLAEVGDTETPSYHPDAHGRPGQRLDAFNEGFEGRTCTSDEFFKTLGIDRDSVQLAPAGRGSVQALLKPQVGSFVRGPAPRTNELVYRGAIETMDATYRSSGRIELKVRVAKFSNLKLSTEYFDFILARLTQSGFKETRRARVVPAGQSGDTGTLIVLDKEVETVVWTNGIVFTSVEGPLDRVWEFVQAFL